MFITKDNYLDSTLDELFMFDSNLKGFFRFDRNVSTDSSSKAATSRGSPFCSILQNLLDCSSRFDKERILIHAVSNCKKRLYKKQLVDFKETKKRRVVSIYQVKKHNSKKHLWM
jgi:ferredoxin-NADP reductase